jgi:hypothetical protein
MFFAPVITTLPEKNIGSTMGSEVGLYIKPGNMFG